MTKFKLIAAINLSGGKHKQNISLFMNLKLYLSHSLHSPCQRLDDELAKCELATGTALFMDDQPSQKSPGQWYVAHPPEMSHPDAFWQASFH